MTGPLLVLALVAVVLLADVLTEPRSVNQDFARRHAGEERVARARGAELQSGWKARRPGGTPPHDCHDSPHMAGGHVDVVNGQAFCLRCRRWFRW